MTTPIAAYGSWPSPITAADVAAASGSMSELVGDEVGLWWLETSPARDGRAAVMCLDDDGVHQITDDEISVRSRVNEYGGGTLDARAGHLVFCDDTHSCLVVRTPDGTMHQLTEPFLSPIRRVLPALGGLDLSVLVAFIGLQAINYLLGDLFGQLWWMI